MDRLFEQKHLSRSMAVCGWKLRALRARRGWTQIELAARAGYCERLVRKAELNGTIARETLEVLAITLSDDQLTVRPVDLIGNSDTDRSIQRLLYGCTAEEFLELATAEIEVDCSRVDQRLPLSGKFKGRCDCMIWYRNLLALTGSEKTQLSLPISIENSEHGFLHVDCVFYREVEPNVQFEIDLRYTLERGKISKIIWLSALTPLVACDSFWHIESCRFVGPMESIDAHRN
jgi:transcriptional regulator with XRE-family HTH domain